MQALIRWSLLVVPLAAMASCSPPPAEPETDGGYARNGRARAFIDAQLASHPAGTEPGLSGDEATVIYRNYLRSIGRQMTGSGQQGQAGQSGLGTEGSGLSGGLSGAGGTGGGYP